MSLPKTDTGKGSSRRPEDSKKYRDNFDKIFTKKEKEDNEDCK